MIETKYERNKDVEEALKEILVKFGTLTEEEVIFYLTRKLTHRPPETISLAINSAVNSGLVIRDGLNLTMIKNRIERDMAIAFRVFAECCDQNSHSIPADWPSSIIFTKEGEKHPCRITVCSNADVDNNMSSLINKRWDGHFHEIIVGVNFSADKLNPQLIPESKVTFAEYRADRILIDTPTLTYTRIKENKE